MLLAGQMLLLEGALGQPAARVLMEPLLQLPPNLPFPVAPSDAIQQLLQ